MPLVVFAMQAPHANINILIGNNTGGEELGLCSNEGQGKEMFILLKRARTNVEVSPWRGVNVGEMCSRTVENFCQTEEET